LASFLLSLGSSNAKGDVGVVLNESLDPSVSQDYRLGSYCGLLSRICPESPIKLRLCQPGEQGSVISNYISLGEDQPFEWNIVPVNVYLYGVENPRYRPIVGRRRSARSRRTISREIFIRILRQRVLQTSHKAEWRNGRSHARAQYLHVRVDTTVEQDLALVEQFNAEANQNHFNGVTRNCADFTRRIINTYFPNATDLITLMTSA